MRNSSTIFDGLVGEINRKDVAHFLGYRKKNVDIPLSLIAIIEEEIRIGLQLRKPGGVWEKYRIYIINDIINLEGKAAFNSLKLSAWMAGCDYLYLFAVTAGPLFGERVEQLLKLQDVSRAMVADAVGSACAESCADEANVRIIALEPNCKFTKRYSPGYGDWNVEQNRELIELLEAGKIGITVNQGGMMQPVKSVSAAIGVKAL